VSVFLRAAHKPCFRF